MKKLITILLCALILTSCKTTEDCGCYSQHIPIKDTIIIPDLHDHVEFEGETYCLYIEGFTYVEEDTLWVECLKFDVNE